MKKKQWFTVLVLIVLSGLTLYILSTKKKSTLNEYEKDFSVKDTASIDKIFIAEKNGHTALLERKAKGEWTINGKYPARMDAVSLLLYTFARTEVKYLPGEKAKETIIRAIATEGKKVEVYQNGKRSKIWYVGVSTPDQTGTFMLLADPDTDEKHEQPFITSIPGFDGFLNTRFFTDENDWRNRTLLSIAPDQMKSLKIEYADFPDSSFQIQVKDIQHFTISTLKGSPLATADTAAIKQYLAYFMDLTAEVYLNSNTEAVVDSLRRTNHYAQLTVTDKNGKESQLRFFHKQPEKGKEEVYGVKVQFDPDHVYISYNNLNEFAMGQYFTFGKIFQSLRYFSPKTVKK